jgi:hypothetical protein
MANSKIDKEKLSLMIPISKPKTIAPVPRSIRKPKIVLAEDMLVSPIKK